jgi:signal transduction histidine kinase
LENAVKFTTGGEAIGLRVHAEGHHLFLDVFDSGAGIAPEHLPHVFERFSSFGTGDGRGTGLGLSIAKATIEAHGGAITATSQLGVGTTFRIRLPGLRSTTPRVDVQPPRRSHVPDPTQAGQ